MKKIFLTLFVTLATPFVAYSDTSLHQLSQHMETLARQAQREFVTVQQDKQTLTQVSIDKAKEHLEALKEKTQQLVEKTDQMIEELKNR